MKLYNQGATPASVTSPVSFAGLIEKIEILRSTLRWASRLDRPEIEKLLKQATTLRDEVMGLSHKERFVQAASSAEAAAGSAGESAPFADVQPYGTHLQYVRHTPGRTS